MTTSADLNIEIGLPFPQAGVVFNIKVHGQPGEPANAPTFRLDVTNPSGGRVAFTSDQCPQLADWVRGYSRWLYRARVRATHDQNSITGAFDGDRNVEQILEGLQLACDMIQQRFELYEESILV